MVLYASTVANFGVFSFETTAAGNLVASAHLSVGHLLDPNSRLPLEASYTIMITHLFGNSNLYNVFVAPIVLLVVAL